MKFPQISPALGRIIGCVAAGLVAFYFILPHILPVSEHKPSWEEVSAAITEASRTMLPKRTGDTTLVEIRPGRPWELNYRYVIDDESARTARDPEVREAFARLLRRQLETNRRESTTNSMAMIRKLGIKCIHRYEDSAGQIVIELTVGPEQDKR